MTNHIQTFTDTLLTFKMIAIEGGSFKLGNNEIISLDDYWMAEFPVTQLLWHYVMKETDLANPSYYKGQNHPVEQISWENIWDIFLPLLNEMTNNTRPKDTIYRLPIEAEWEYAAKGGKYAKEFPFHYAGGNKLNTVGWYYSNSYSETKPVGLKDPNLLGLYDMSGNVWEWCEHNWQGKKDTTSREIRAFVHGDKTATRLQRGGSWRDDEKYCQTKNRNNYSSENRIYNFGFRLALKRMFR